MKAGRPARKVRWLLVVVGLPLKPAYLRVKVGRRLRNLGAVPIKNTVYAAPATESYRAGLATLVEEIQREGGDGTLCEAHFVAGLSDDSVEDLFRKVRTSEYAAISKEAGLLERALGRGSAVREARRRSTASKLKRLQLRFAETVAKDPFESSGREAAAGLLSLVEDRLQGVHSGAKRSEWREAPRAAIWVTRTGVMVDRIASAWLIRRFIDPDARFKFVSERRHRPSRGELRFDMAGAEFTHRGGNCTFEVLLESFRIRDSALWPIAEIVHDLDLTDERYGRPEAAGLDRLIVGIALSTTRDEVRVAQGSTVFDNLYEYFRKHRSEIATGPPEAAKRDHAPQPTRPPMTHGRQR